MIQRRRTLLIAPLAIAALGGAGFLAMLRRMAAGKFDPHDVPSPLIGHKVPDCALPPLMGHQGFNTAALHVAPGPVLVNFFASWCVPCVQEAPTLATLHDLPIWGVAYKDPPSATAAFLDRHGNPYARVVADRDGRAGIDWGVTGVPESFLVDRGMIRWHWSGPLTDALIAEQIRPRLHGPA